ncbi:MAG: NIF family HAD-type phosphatase, partial [Mycetocola sp.]
PPVWAFDVDGTLIGSIRSDRTRPGARELLEELDRRGVVVVLWSAGGDEYAQRVAVRHGLDDIVAGFYGKDERGPDGRYLIDHFADDHRPLVFVDDVPGDLPRDACIVGVPQFFGSNTADASLRDVRAGLDELSERPWVPVQCQLSGSKCGARGLPVYVPS